MLVPPWMPIPPPCYGGIETVIAMLTDKLVDLRNLPENYRSRVVLSRDPRLLRHILPDRDSATRAAIDSAIAGPRAFADFAGLEMWVEAVLPSHSAVWGYTS